MKYQLEYDKVLIADKPFILEETGELVTDLSLFIRFGTVFQGENGTEVKVEVGDSYHCLSDLLRVSYSQSARSLDFHLNGAYEEGYEVSGYFISVGDVISFPRECSKEEFNKIIFKYGQHFSSDHSLQNCSYGFHVVSEEVEKSKKVQPFENKEYPKFVMQLEEKLQVQKEKVDSIPRIGSMAVQYRSDALHQMNTIEFMENKKNWLIDQTDENRDVLEIVNCYYNLIYLYEQHFNYLNQEGVYVVK